MRPALLLLLLLRAAAAHAGPDQPWLDDDAPGAEASLFILLLLAAVVAGRSGRDAVLQGLRWMGGLWLVIAGLLACILGVSWIASELGVPGVFCPMVGVLLGAALFGWLIDRAGEKKKRP